MNITFASVLLGAWFVPVPPALMGAIWTCFGKERAGIVHGLKMSGGSPLLFAFVSAVIGLYKIKGSLQALPFKRSMALGSVGLVLTGFGINRAFTRSPG